MWTYVKRTKMCTHLEAFSDVRKWSHFSHRICF